MANNFHSFPLVIILFGDKKQFIIFCDSTHYLFVSRPSLKSSILSDFDGKTSRAELRRKSTALKKPTMTFFVNRVQLFVCGEEYYSRLARSLLQARSFIMIRDWRIAPDLYLRRRSGFKKGNLRGAAGQTNDQSYRLDSILQKKASEGVMVYIILYEEIGIFNGSESAQERLEKLHRNILVLRHRSPHTNEMFWSHHEKFVNVDGCICYIGGIDLCHGRFDTTNHPLWDASPPYLFPGCDYSNPQVDGCAWNKEAFMKPNLDIAGVSRTTFSVPQQNGIFVDSFTNEKALKNTKEWYRKCVQTDCIADVNELFQINKRANSLEIFDSTTSEKKKKALTQYQKGTWLVQL